MSSFKKTIAILDLFNIDQIKLTIEEISELLQAPIPTVYRYVRELCDVGLLVRFKGGEYSIGPKAIELDFLIRQSDVVISKGIHEMQKLVNLTGCDVLYGSLYNNTVILSHEEQPSIQLPNRSIIRGKKLHPFKGSTAKAIISNLSKSKVHTLYEQYKDDSVVQKFAKDFDSCWRQLLEIKKQGYVKSDGEVDLDKVSFSMPIFSENQIRGAITLGVQRERYELFDEKKLLELLAETAQKLTALLEE